MLIPKSGHTSTLLKSNKILINGGSIISDSNTTPKQQELFDLIHMKSTLIADPNNIYKTGYNSQNNILLPNGNVFIALSNYAPYKSLLYNYKIYDADKNIFVYEGNEKNRSYISKVALINNNKILVIRANHGNLLNIRIYDANDYY